MAKNNLIKLPASRKGVTVYINPDHICSIEFKPGSDRLKDSLTIELVTGKELKLSHKLNIAAM